VIVPRLAVKVTGGFSVELPEACEASIAPESVRVTPVEPLMVYPLPAIVSFPNDPPEISSLLVRAAPERPVGKIRSLPGVPDVGGESQLPLSD
jgi:hypothetical protein